MNLFIDDSLNLNVKNLECVNFFHKVDPILITTIYSY